MSDTIQCNGNKIFVEYHLKDASKPTMIFLHDSLGSTQLWRDFPQKLSEMTGFNWMSYDRLGYGKSNPMPSFERPVNYMEEEADFLIELLSELKIEKPVLFGHSDGGSIALWVAAKYPGNFAALIVEAAHIFVEEITLEGIRTAKEAYATTNLKERLEKYHGNKTESIFKAWTETWLRDDFRYWSIENILHQIDCPVLFIQGEKDEYGTLDQMHQTLEKINAFTDHLVIPDVGHTPHKQNPEPVLKKAAEFLKKIYQN